MIMVSHLRNLWGPFWPLAFAPLMLPAFLAAIGDLRPEHLIVSALITLLAIATSATRNLLVATLPGIAIAAGYELIRYLRPVFVTPDRTLGCELQALERTLFSAGQGQTVADYFSVNNSPALDLFFAAPYTLFWGIAIGFSLLLYWWRREQLNDYLWLLAIVHAAAFVIWLWLPAAPPWYVRSHGCTIDIEALPSAAALLRIDAMFGISYFESFYSRAPTVFGALPSLHCAFPIVGLLSSWRFARWPERLVHVGYTLWMLAASVYLDHHWLLDGLLGIAIAVLVYLVFFRRGVPRSLGTVRPSAG